MLKFLNPKVVLFPEKWRPVLNIKNILLFLKLSSPFLTLHINIFDILFFRLQPIF